MGWLYTSNLTRKEQIAARTSGYKRDDVSPEWFKRFTEGKLPEGAKPEDYRFEADCLKGCFRGSAWKGTLWTVWEQRLISKATGEVAIAERYIGCDLLQYDNTCHGWGYKDMDESSGPYVFNCPLSYLEMVPCPGGYATEWRESVHAYHGYRGPIHVGERVELRDLVLPWVTVASVKPLLGRGPDGKVYNLRRKNIAGIFQSKAVKV